MVKKFNDATFSIIIKMIFSCHVPLHFSSTFDQRSYLIVSIVSSSIGILGAVYQIFIRKNQVEGGTSRSLMGRKIIVYLAWSDLFASAGVFFRSSLWSYLRTKLPYEDDSVSVLFCSISSVSQLLSSRSLL